MLAILTKNVTIKYVVLTKIERYYKYESNY